MNINKVMVALTAGLLSLAFLIPTNTYAASSSLDYEYVDENGNVMEDEEVYSVTKDTSWFDYQNLQDEYDISTEAQLIGLASLVNQKQKDRWKPERYETFEGITINLTNDIQLTQDWTPIGNDSTIVFKGTFNGNGYTISNLNIESSDEYTGFFAYLDGTIKNLTLEGSINSGSDACGAFAGYLTENGRIVSCKNHVTVKGKGKTGGIVGENNGKIKGSFNYGTVKGTVKVGGIVGENRGRVKECGNRGSVKSTKRGFATYGTGGIAGRSLAGARIDGCYNTGKITSSTEGTGGIAGYVNVKGTRIINSYNTGDIVVRDNSTGTTVALSKKSVKGYAGGIVGIMGSRGVIIKNCYNSGQITNSDISGGIVGYYTVNVKNDEPQIQNNYYLASDIKNGIGSDSSGRHPSISGAKGLSMSALMSNTSSLGIAYREDRTGLYGNDGYPVLSWQEELSEDEREYLPHISKALQEKLDEYTKKSAKIESKSLKMFFDFTDINIENIGEFNEDKHI